MPFEIFGLFLIFLGSALSNAGGIGGGGLLLPILLLVMRFYTHEAIPISKLMIFAGAISSFIMNLQHKHPFREGVVIDYNIPFIIVPMLLFGTMIGVTLNKVFPPWIILVCLTLVLVINTYKTIKKANKLAKEEKEKLKEQENGKDQHQILTDIKDKDSKIADEKDLHSINSNFDNDTNSTNTNNQSLVTVNRDVNIVVGENERKNFLEKETEKDKRKFPYEKYSVMVMFYILMLTVNLLKGTSKFESLIGIKK